MAKVKNAFNLPNTIEQSNMTGQKTGFTIDNNPFMFKALSANLYRDPMLAVLREYRNNAWDSHYVAKQTRPVELTLPTYEQLPAPYFEVKDFGVGLSPEQVHSLFTTYGASDKRGDAVNQIGGFGLGSKSAFGYADQFTVRSRWHGKEYVYLCKIENNLPTIQHVETLDTNEPNGLTIRVGVRRDDISTFVEKYKNIRKWCDNEDKLNISVAITKPTATAQGKGWMIVAGEDCKGPSVLLGNVLYTLDWSSIPNSGKAESLFRDTPLVLIFGAKELTPAPSREDLSYDRDLTVPSIRGRLEKCMAEVLKTTKDEIAKCGSLWEAQIKYNTLAFGNGLVARADFWYKSTPLRINTGQYLKNDPVMLPTGLTGQVLGPPIHLNYFRKSINNNTRRYKDGLTQRYIEYDDRTKILYHPGPENKLHAINAWNRMIYAFDGKDGFTDTYSMKHMHIFVGPWYKFMAVLRMLGCPPYELLEDVLPEEDEFNLWRKMNRKVSAKRSAAKPNVLIGSHIDRYTSNFRKKEIIIEEEVGYYVKTDGYKPLEISTRELQSAITVGAVEQEGLVFASKSWHKKFDESSNWTNLLDVFPSKVVSWVNANGKAAAELRHIITPGDLQSCVLTKLGYVKPRRGEPLSYHKKQCYQILCEYLRNANYTFSVPDLTKLNDDIAIWNSKVNELAKKPLISFVQWSSIYNKQPHDLDAFVDFVIKHYNLK